MPSYEIIIKQKYSISFPIVWNMCNIPLYRHARDYIHKKQKPVKVVVGCDFTFFEKIQMVI